MARIVSLLALFGTFQTALAAYKPRTILYERNLPEAMTAAPTMPNPAKGKGVPAKGGSGGKKASYADLYDIENEIHKMLEPTGSPVYSSTTSAPQKAATASPIYYSKGKGKGKGVVAKGKGKGISTAKSAKSGKKSSVSKGFDSPSYIVVPTTPPPVTAPVSSGSGDPPSATPNATVAPPTGGSSQQSVGTPPPTQPGPAIETALYELTLSYSPASAAVSADDIAEFEAATAEYLNDFFAVNFADPNQNSVFSFNEAVTTRQGGSNTLHQFKTVVHFFPDTRVPPTRDLDNAIEFAFVQGRDDYLDDLEALNSVYAGTTSVSFDFADPAPAVEQSAEQETTGSSESSGGSAAPASIGAAAGAMALLLGGMLMYRRRRSRQDGGKDIDDADGHFTVAGDTYAGETSMGDNNSEAVYPGMHNDAYSAADHTYAGDRSCNNDDAASVKSATSIGASDWTDFRKILHPDPMLYPEYDNMSSALQQGRSQSEYYEGHETSADNQSIGSHDSSHVLHQPQPLQSSRLSNVREEANDDDNEEGEEEEVCIEEDFSDEYSSSDDGSDQMGLDHSQLEDVQL